MIARGLLLSCLLALSACNTPSALDPRCDGVDDPSCALCDPSVEGSCAWGKACDPELRVCLPDPAMLVGACDPEAALDEPNGCNIAQACDPDTKKCYPRPINIGVVSREQDVDAKIRRVYNTYNITMIDYMWERKLRQHFDALAIPVQIESVDAGPTASESLLYIPTQLTPDTDSFITFESRHHEAVSTWLAEKKSGVLVGQYARGITQYERDRCQRSQKQLPELDQRFDFSIVPFQTADYILEAQNISRELGCSHAAYMYNANGFASIVRHALRGEWYTLAGIRYTGVATTPDDLADPTALMLELLDTGADCIILPSLPIMHAYVAAQKADPSLDHRFLLTPLYAAEPETNDAAVVLEALKTSLAERALFVGFDIERFSKNDVALEEYARVYNNYFNALCLDEELSANDNCSIRDANYFAPSPFRFAYPVDMITLTALAHYRSLVREIDFSSDTPPHKQQLDITPEELRDSFLALTTLEDDDEHVLCDYTTLSKCFESLKNGREAHYLGLSSPMLLAPDGRMQALYEEMFFKKITPGGDLVDVARYASEEMYEQRSLAEAERFDAAEFVARPDECEETR